MILITAVSNRLMF